MGWVKYFYYRKPNNVNYSRHMMSCLCGVWRRCTMLMFSSYVFFLVSCHFGIHIRHYLSSLSLCWPTTKLLKYSIIIESENVFVFQLDFSSVGNREFSFLKIEFNKVDNYFPTSFYGNFSRDPITLNGQWRKQKLQFISQNVEM